MGTTERLRIIGLHFLSELFVLSGDDTTREFNIYEIGSKCGCSMKEARQIRARLSTLDLVQNRRNVDEVSITQKGIELMKGERTVSYSAPIY